MKKHFLLILAIFAIGCSKNSAPQTDPEKKPEYESVPDKEGMNVKGRVVDTDGNKLAGVVVSDGIQCVQTDSSGLFYMKSDFDASKYVFVVTPSGYEVLFDNRYMYSGFKAVSAMTKVNEVNFTLVPRKGDTDNYKMLFLGDPQVMSSRPHSGESWKWVTKRLNEYRKTVNEDLYQILLGDMVTNEIEVAGMAQSFINTSATAQIPTFCVCGNHDHVQNAKTYHESISEYLRHFGPTTFAVNIGKVHYVFFDTCDWSNGGYKLGIPDECWEFIKSDLQFVPKDTPIVFSTHIALTRMYAGLYPYTTNKHYTDLMELLKGRDVSFWYGHAHFTCFWNYVDSMLEAKCPGVKSLESHLVGRCGGCWECSGEVCRDGCPRGVVEVTVRGREMQWRYISLDENYPSDFNVLAPGAFKGENLPDYDDKVLYCNVYIWDNIWKYPDLWVDGKKYSSMKHCTDGKYVASVTYDPWFSHFYPIWRDQNIKGFRSDPPLPQDNSHLFSVVPPAGVHEGEIHIVDRWGNVLRRPISW